jgi:hypothetical protein
MKDRKFPHIQNVSALQQKNWNLGSTGCDEKINIITFIVRSYEF